MSHSKASSQGATDGGRLGAPQLPLLGQPQGQHLPRAAATRAADGGSRCSPPFPTGCPCTRPCSQEVKTRPHFRVGDTQPEKKLPGSSGAAPARAAPAGAAAAADHGDTAAAPTAAAAAGAAGRAAANPVAPAGGTAAPAAPAASTASAATAASAASTASAASAASAATAAATAASTATAPHGVSREDSGQVRRAIRRGRGGSDAAFRWGTPLYTSTTSQASALFTCLPSKDLTRPLPPFLVEVVVSYPC
ncbi:translation initiation factor IF-2-like [Canis lupus dingo]|uniref:translation initiation factor IF-2-like n=1 Tax=Canis lupus dingo TaxID=286419 RepID=UPI000DC691EC|nr:translation initiation factor IF-2-like [Canis lupus dingo]XP_048957358.1 translation initiation factor IF-2-like [Canis lupus dingo]